MSQDGYIKREDMECLYRQFPCFQRDIIDSVAQQYQFDLQKTAYYLYEIMKQGPQKSEFSKEESRVIDIIRKGWKVIVLMRGLPGSGKTYLANKIFKASYINYPPEQFILSTDDYFKKSGKYNYDVTQLEIAHDWNQKRCYKLMSRGFSPIIIDNTNLVSWEMRVYCMMAVEYGYVIEILEANTDWAGDPSILAKKNNHKVPKEKIVRMLNRFDRTITTTSLLKEFRLNGMEGVPQKRLFPPLFTTTENNLNPTCGRGVNTANLLSSTSLDDFDFLFEKKTNYEPVMEYVHSFDDKKDAVKKETPKEVKMDNNATSLYPSSSVASGQNKSLIEFASIQSEPKTNQAEVKTQSDEIKTVQNEPKQDSPSEPKIPKSEPQANLIDLLDDNASSSSSGVLTLFGAFPLMPTNVTAYLKNLQSQSSQDKSKTDSKSSNSNENNHLTAWGTNERALQSWETVVNVPSTKLPTELDFEIYRKLDDASRPKILHSDKTTNTHSDDFRFAQNCPEADGVSILNTESRAINSGKTGITITKCAPRKKITVDMGCMTEEDEIDPGINKTQIEQQLKDLFPDIPIEYMFDVYEKCKRDINWTIDILFETPYDPKLEVEKKKIEVENNNDKSKVTSLPIINSWESPEIMPSKKEINDQLKQEKIELKKKFEENVTFKKEHYSDFLWEVIKKHQRQGTPPETPQTSKVSPQTSVELNDATQDVDYEFDEEDEETVSINLGHDLVGQLEKHLGSEDFINKNLPTSVQMPISMVKQLHALYLQSVCQQIEEQNELVSKDEQYAHKLNNEEHEAVNGPNLTMIMDEQLAKFCQKKENEQYKTMTPQTLAMIMKRNKLYDSFPTVNKTMIDQLLQSHNYNYDEVVDTLIANVNQKYIVSTGNVREDPVSDEMVKDMVENKAIAEQVKNDEDYHDAKQFRDDAEAYGQKARYLQNLAQQYHRKGMGQVAVFYSKLAEDLRRKSDLCDQKATFRYLYENSLQCRSDTLDLHYLKVAEALISLDIYIDKWVAKLDKPKDCFVITGQGNRSVGGKSRLKPAVIARLRKRKIGFTLMNPGLLRIKLHKNVTLTNDLKK